MFFALVGVDASTHTLVNITSLGNPLIISTPNGNSSNTTNYTSVDGTISTYGQYFIQQRLVKIDFPSNYYYGFSINFSPTNSFNKVIDTTKTYDISFMVFAPHGNFQNIGVLDTFAHINRNYCQVSHNTSNFNVNDYDLNLNGYYEGDSTVKQYDEWYDYYNTGVLDFSDNTNRNNKNNFYSYVLQSSWYMISCSNVELGSDNFFQFYHNVSSGEKFSSVYIGGYWNITPHFEDQLLFETEQQTEKIEEQNKLTQEQTEKIEEQTQQQQQNHEETMNTITDSSSNGATNSAGGFFNNFDDNDFGLSGVITAPLNTIKTITNNACTPLSLTIPFVNKDMNLPCMTNIYEEYFGSFLDIYQIITFGIISYWVCVQIYAMVKGFKNPDKDEIEVMDL